MLLICSHLALLSRVDCSRGYLGSMQVRLQGAQLSAQITRSLSPVAQPLTSLWPPVH